MLTNTEIHAYYQHMRQYNHISTYVYPEYIIHFQGKDTIKLHGGWGEIALIPTTQLSDIHAILQLCHPDTPYCIRHHIYLSEKLPNLIIYSHQHAPNILTNKIPPTHHDNSYIMQPTPECYITIQPNEPLMDAIPRFKEQAKQSFAFIHQYPHIDVDSQQSLNNVQKIPHIHNTEIRMTASRVHPSNIEITFALSNESNWADIDTFIIPTQDLPALADRYTAHMHHITPKLIQDIQHSFAGSQHEKMRIIRQVIPYLTHTNNELFTCIQDCVHILMNHYAHVPPISQP